MKNFFLVLALIVILTSCARTIIDRIYKVTTVIENTLSIPVNVKYYEDGINIINKTIPSGDSAVLSSTHELDLPFKFTSVDSVQIFINGKNKTDYSCYSISDLNEQYCQGDTVNILNEKQYETKVLGPWETYKKYKIDENDLREAQEQLNNLFGTYLSNF